MRTRPEFQNNAFSMAGQKVGQAEQAAQAGGLAGQARQSGQARQALQAGNPIIAQVALETICRNLLLESEGDGTERVDNGTETPSSGAEAPQDEASQAGAGGSQPIAQTPSGAEI